MMFVNTVKYFTIREILSLWYFSDFAMYHNLSHVSQYCTLYCTDCTAPFADELHPAVALPAGPPPGPVTVTVTVTVAIPLKLMLLRPGCQGPA